MSKKRRVYSAQLFLLLLLLPIFPTRVNGAQQLF
jgi:hypothetical protein